MPIILTVYRTDNRIEYPIRVDSSVLLFRNMTRGLVNVATGGAPDAQAGSASAARLRRPIGVNARYITMRWTEAPPDGYNPEGVIRVIILQPFLMHKSAIGDLCRFKNYDGQIVGLTNEKIN